MAIYIIQACSERLTTKNVDFMAHEPLMANVRGNEHELRRRADEIGVVSKNMSEFIGRRLKIGVAGYRKMTRDRNWHFDWEVALDIGAVDRVIEREEIPQVIDAPEAI
jgi:ATP-dependent protease ClpP protease subunit